MLDPEFFQLGEVYELDAPYPPRVQTFIDAVNRYPFGYLVGVCRIGSDCMIEVTFDVERPQTPVVPILYQERIGIVLPENPNQLPMAWALRKDFPQTLHQNLTPPDHPRILCLFDTDHHDVMIRLTAAEFIQRTANWLKRAAIEDLHTEDQPLEPLLLTKRLILFDSGVFNTEEEKDVIWMVEQLSGTPLILRAHRIPANTNLSKSQRQFGYVVLPIITDVRYSRVIEYEPHSLQSLRDLFVRLDFDLIAPMRSYIQGIKNSDEWNTLKHFKLIVLLALPKSRNADGVAEEIETWAFLVSNSLEDLGEKVGIFRKVDGVIGFPLYPEDPHSLSEVFVYPLKPIFRLDRNFAQRLSGITPNNFKIVAIGAGALGSQVVMNLARQGFGQWTIVDDDNLLPHNLTRHSLSPYFEGCNKAEALAIEVRQLLNEDNAAKSGTSSFHDYDGTETAELFTAFSDCDLVLDLSASHSVSSRLTHTSGPRNRVTAFIGPEGLYFALIAEGKKRVARLDDLEAQLSAAIVNDAQVSDFYEKQGNTIRYAGSCRDTSTQLPQDIVALYSGIASHWIKNHIDAEEPSIHIWKWSPNAVSIEHIQLNAQPVIGKIIRDWEVRISESVNRAMHHARQQRFPNETGGVLLGTIDIQHKVVQIADLIPSPPDSVEWPTMYIRGSENLRNQIDRKFVLSGRDLRYVGEWHTHPRGHTSEPSKLDLEAHRYLTEQMAAEGLPGIVIILGDDYEPCVLLKLMD